MAKSQTAWSSSSKNSDPWVVAGRTPTSWGNESNFPVSYTYSDPTLTYSSSTRTYNYISAVPADQSNSKNPTTWAGESKNTVSWSNESPVQVGYLYDSSATYDSPFAYDYTTAAANQSNSKNATAWVST